MNVIEIALVLLGYGIYVAFRFHQANAATAHQSRLDRIRYVACFFKWISCAGFGCVFFVAAIAIFAPDMVGKNLNHTGSTSMSGPISISVSGPILIGDFKPVYRWLYPIFWIFLIAFICRGIGFFYRLFGNLEKGVIFGRDNVRCIRGIGLLLVVAPLLGVGFEISKLVWAVQVPVLIDTANVPSDLFEGFFVIFIAWIMDEGRKIQEEQELTV